MCVRRDSNPDQSLSPMEGDYCTLQLQTLNPLDQVANWCLLWETEKILLIKIANF